MLNKILPPVFMMKQFKKLPKDSQEDLYVLDHGGFY